jgi:hypothetical protein
MRDNMPVPMASKYTDLAERSTPCGRVRLLLAASWMLFVLSMGAPLVAQDPPPADLSGTWKLNISRSTPPARFHITKETIVITYSGQTIRIHYKNFGTSTYVADGKARDDFRATGSHDSWKAEWQGGALMVEEIHYWFQSDGEKWDIPPDDKKTYWRLSADGQTLLRETDNPKGVLLYEKVGK